MRMSYGGLPFTGEFARPLANCHRTLRIPWRPPILCDARFQASHAAPSRAERYLTVARCSLVGASVHDAGVPGIRNSKLQHVTAIVRILGSKLIRAQSAAHAQLPNNNTLLCDAPQDVRLTNRITYGAGLLRGSLDGRVKSPATTR